MSDQQLAYDKAKRDSGRCLTWGEMMRCCRFICTNYEDVIKIRDPEQLYEYAESLPRQLSINNLDYIMDIMEPMLSKEHPAIKPWREYGLKYGLM